MIKTEKYDRRPLQVEGVQVTEGNMESVAAWCGGEVIPTKGPRGNYIKVPVIHPLNDSQTRAHVGSWVLFSEKGFKVYTERSFANSFNPAGEGESTDQVHNIFEAGAED